MARPGGRFTVDVDELRRVTGEMATCEDSLRDLADQVSRRVEALHETWDGRAAVAQDAAQHEWEAGFRSMREALVRMRAAASVAHDNYTSAALANVEMWGRLR